MVKGVRKIQDGYYECEYCGFSARRKSEVVNHLNDCQYQYEYD